MFDLTIADIRKYLESYSSGEADASKIYNYSAVCLVLSRYEKKGELRVLMMQRAKHWKDPWSGHMAFPGGRIEDTDSSMRAGALRELSEEMGVEQSQLNYLGRLSDVFTLNIPKKKQLVISPFVFEAKETLMLKPNYEVANTFWIPLSFFMRAKRRNMFWYRRRRVMRLPFYRYKRQRIWGLSLAMLDELFEVVNHPLSKRSIGRIYQRK